MNFKNMRFAIIVITVMTCFSLLVFCDDEPIISSEPVKPVMISYNAEENNGDISLYDESDMYEYIASEMRKMTEKIDVSKYNLLISDFKTVLSTVLHTNYELYYIDSSYYWYIGDKITAIQPVYTEDSETVEKTVAAMNERMDYFLSYINDSMTDLEKVVTLHDRLALECEYDYSENEYRFTAMSALLNGKSVCQGYTDLFYTFMEKLDIPCAFVVSASANHTWNAVKLDGNWYHIDVTYDDPTYSGGNDGYTKVSHYWMLKSNNYFLTRLGENGASSHGNDFELLESDSTKYDSAFWNSVKSPIITLAGVMYYVDTATSLGSLYSYSTSTEKTDPLYTFTDKWHIAASSTSFWKGVYSGLAYENGKLYFNTSSAIMSCELDGSNVTVEYQPELSADYSVYGCFEKNGKLYYGIGKKAIASYIAPGSAVDFTDTAESHFICIDEYVRNGKKTISFVNETKKDCIVTVIRKKNGRFDGCELVPVKGKTATVEVCGENDSASVIVIDENLSPVCEKIEEV